MWKLAVATVLLVTACSGYDAASTSQSSSITTVTTTTTSTLAPATTSTPSTASPDTTTVPTGFSLFSHPQFTAVIPDGWSENLDFPGTGAGFREDHTALALPPTSLDIFLEEREAGFDLDGHVQRIQDDRAAVVVDFRVLQSGEQDVDGGRSLWFEYAEQFDGFPLVVREQVALKGTLLVTFMLISPVEFFEFDAGQLEQLVKGFQFS